MSYRVSSNLTFLLRIALPTMWLSFFGLFAIAFFVADPEHMPLLYNPSFRWFYLLAYTSFALLIWRTLMQLYRVEYDTGGIYVTNYFRTVRYDWDSVDRIKTIHLGLFKINSIHLKDKGRFGRKIKYLVARTRFNTLMSDLPAVAARHQ